MLPTDFGPVPVSRLKEESREIFKALGEGRRVLVSKRGDIVAAIEPPGEERLLEVATYALPRTRPLPELTASEINQSASPAIARALEGETLYVTRDDQVYGFLRAVEPHELASESLRMGDYEEMDDQISAYLEQHPDASASDLVRLRAGGLEEERRAHPGAGEPCGRHDDPEDVLETFLQSSVLASAAVASLGVSPALRFAVRHVATQLRGEFPMSDPTDVVHRGPAT